MNSIAFALGFLQEKGTEQAREKVISNWTICWQPLLFVWLFRHENKPVWEPRSPFRWMSHCYWHAATSHCIPLCQVAFCTAQPRSVASWLYPQPMFTTAFTASRKAPSRRSLQHVLSTLAYQEWCQAYKMAIVTKNASSGEQEYASVVEANNEFTFPGQSASYYISHIPNWFNWVQCLD